MAVRAQGMTKSSIHNHGSALFTENFEDDFGRYSCNWDEWPCPSAEVTYRLFGGASDPMIFCARHYAAWLERFIALHPFECEAPPATHHFKLNPNE